MKCALTLLLVVGLFGLFSTCTAEEVTSLRLVNFYRFVQKHPKVVMLVCLDTDDYCQVTRAIQNDVVAKLDEVPGKVDDIRFGYFLLKDSDLSAVRPFGVSAGKFLFFQNKKVHHQLSVSEVKTPSDLRQFLKQCSMDSVEEFVTMEQFNEEVKSCSGELSTVVYFADGKHDAIEKTLLKIFLEFPDTFQVGVVRDSSLISKIGATSGQVKVYQCYDHTLSKEFTHTVDDDVAALRTWILHRGTPLVAKATKETVKRALELFGECVVVAVPEEQQTEVIDMITRVAKKLQSAGIVWDHASGMKQHFIDMGATGNVFPSAMGLLSLSDPPVIWDEKLPFDEENFARWVQAVEKKEAESFRKSAPVPEPQPGERVQTLVYETFMPVVGQSGDRAVLMASRQKDSFPVDFYVYDVTENFHAQKLTRMPEAYLYKGEEIFRFPESSISGKGLERWVYNLMGIPFGHDEL